MLLTFYYNVKDYLKNKSGQGLMEYALIISLIAMVLIGAVTAFGNELNALLDFIVSKVTM